MPMQPPAEQDPAHIYELPVEDFPFDVVEELRQDILQFLHTQPLQPAMPQPTPVRILSIYPQKKKNAEFCQMPAPSGPALSFVNQSEAHVRLRPVVINAIRILEELRDVLRADPQLKDRLARLTRRGDKLDEAASFAGLLRARHLSLPDLLFVVLDATDTALPTIGDGHLVLVDKCIVRIIIENLTATQKPFLILYAAAKNKKPRILKRGETEPYGRFVYATKVTADDTSDVEYFYVAWPVAGSWQLWSVPYRVLRPV